MEHKSDVLVIGGGGAAVRAALEAARQKAGVILVDKGGLGRSGTSPLSLHGFATVLHPEDSEEVLMADILRTGSGVNDLDLVRTAVGQTRSEIALLEELGVRFSRNPDNTYYIYKGAGHSVPHNLILDEGANGMNFVALLAMEAWRRGVRLVQGVMITDLLVEEGRCLGAVGIDRTGAVHTFLAAAVVLASGGANRLYPNVVPRIGHPMYATMGDGYGLALRAGLAVVDMEFANFRDSPPAAPLYGTYVNAGGERFMARYDERGEDAPRGKVVEALFREIRAGRGPISIEIDERGERAGRFLPEEYESYVRALKEGKRPAVTITFQRLLGGAEMKPDASSAVEGLFLAGETSGGFHGADRLQGAAFLETQVFGRTAGIQAARFARGAGRRPLSRNLRGPMRERLLALTARRGGPEPRDFVPAIHRLTWDYGSILRDGEGLRTALAALAEIRCGLDTATGAGPFDVAEVQNLALTAEVMFRAALAREETRGTHRRSDFPDSNGEMAGTHFRLWLGRGGEIRHAMRAARP